MSPRALNSRSLFFPRVLSSQGPMGLCYVSITCHMNLANSHIVNALVDIQHRMWKYLNRSSKRNQLHVWSEPSIMPLLHPCSPQLLCFSFIFGCCLSPFLIFPHLYFLSLSSHISVDLSLTSPQNLIHLRYFPASVTPSDLSPCLTCSVIFSLTTLTSRLRHGSPLLSSL